VLVDDLSIPGCPLSRGGIRRFPDGTEFDTADYCGWWQDPNDPRTRNLVSFKPDVVLIEDAINEIVDRKLPDWPDWRHVGDPRFDTWLLNEYRLAANRFSSTGATVVFANAPCADWQRAPHFESMTDSEARVAALNRIYDGVVAATTKVADLFKELCPDGKYTSQVEGVDDGRPDGVHLSSEASSRVAERWLIPILRNAKPTRSPAPSA
jgi:hypothetical protein